MNRRTYKARVTTSFALATWLRKSSTRIGRLQPQPFACACWSAKTWQCCTEYERACGEWRPAEDEPIRRALAILDVAVGKPNEVMPKLEIWSGLKPFLDASESTNLRDGVVSNISKNGLT